MCLQDINEHYTLILIRLLLKIVEEMMQSVRWVLDQGKADPTKVIFSSNVDRLANFSWNVHQC